MRSSLPTVYFPLEEKQRLVNRDEFCEIRSMLFRCAQDDLEPLVPIFSAEQDGHDQLMGKSDLEAVDQAVPCALENGEVVMVSRVVQDGLYCGRHC